MTNEERDRIIGEKLNEGFSLGEVQKYLSDECGITMTYLDLRLVAAELDVDWDKQAGESTRSGVQAADADATAALENEEVDKSAAAPGKTTVSISKVVRPGASISGDVTFASGAQAEWFVDPLGRLGLNPAPGSPEPTQEDIQDFQQELQKKIAGQ